MRRVVFLFLILFLAFPATVSADNHCQFVHGFKTYRDTHGHETVGQCLENEHWHSDGTQQRTTLGTLYWNRTTNAITFVISPPPTPTPVPTPIPTPTPAPLDTRLVSVLELIGDSNSVGADLVAYALAQNVAFRIAPIADVAGQEIMGTYSRSTNTITVSEAYFASRPTAVLAGMLVHELAHVIPVHEEWKELTAEQRCLNREFEAEYFSGLWWHLHYGYRGSTLNSPDARHLNRLALYVRDQGLYGNLRRLANYVRERFREICAARAA